MATERFLACTSASVAQIGIRAEVAQKLTRYDAATVTTTLGPNAMPSPASPAPEIPATTVVRRDRWLRPAAATRPAVPPPTANATWCSAPAR